MDLTEKRTDRMHFWVDSRGLLQGLFTHFYENGIVSNMCYYVDDEMHGEHKSWYEDGKLYSHCYFSNGKEHGEYKLWHRNGNLKTHRFYENGCPHGESKTWHKNGAIDEHVIYVLNDPLDIDPEDLTDKDKLVLTLRHGIQWL